MNLMRSVRLLFCCLLLCCGSGVFAQHFPDSSARRNLYGDAVNTDDLYYDAVKARMLGDDKTAEALLLEVVKQKPDEPAPYYDLSRINAARNNAAKAEEYIRKAVDLDGGNKWYREEYANILVLRSSYDAAAAQYAQLAKEEKFNDDYLLKTAMLYQRSGKYKDAIAALDALEKKNGPDEDVLLQEEQIYLKTNDVEGAAGAVRRLMAYDPREPRYYTMLAEIYDNNNLPAKAKAVYAEMQQKFPNDPSLELLLATQALKRKDTAAYREYVRKAITNKDLDATTQLGLLVPYLQGLSADTFQRHEALRLAEQVVAQHPADAKVVSFYGDVLAFNHEDEQAAAQYKKAVLLDPSGFETWQKLLYHYTDRRDADSLIRYSEKAVRLFPNQAEVHYLNGIGHYNKKEYPTAIRAINRAIDLQPEENTDLLSNMYSTLGDIYHSTKQYKSSDSAFDHAIALNPRNATVLNNYAYYLSERNMRLDDAERMSKQSLEIRPDEATFLDTYGWILFQQGKYEQARTYISKAVDASGNDADAALLEHLGAVEYKLGNADKAVNEWKKAKARGSDNPNIDKMIAEKKWYE